MVVSGMRKAPMPMASLLAVDSPDCALDCGGVWCAMVKWSVVCDCEEREDMPGRDID